MDQVINFVYMSIWVRMIFNLKVGEAVGVGDFVEILQDLEM